MFPPLFLGGGGKLGVFNEIGGGGGRFNPFKGGGGGRFKVGIVRFKGGGGGRFNNGGGGGNTIFPRGGGGGKFAGPLFDPLDEELLFPKLRLASSKALAFIIYYLFPFIYY